MHLTTRMGKKLRVGNFLLKIFPYSDNVQVSCFKSDYHKKHSWTPECEPPAYPSWRSQRSSLVGSERTPRRQDKCGITDVPQGKAKRSRRDRCGQGEANRLWDDWCLPLAEQCNWEVIFEFEFGYNRKWDSKMRLLRIKLVRGDDDVMHILINILCWD